MAIIEVDRLVKRYGGRAAVDGVSFSVEPGEIFGILGPNGAGKTTTVECVEGLRAPDGGEIRVCGLDPRRDEAELRQVLGGQLQESELPDRLRVGEALRLYSSFYREPADWRELAGILGLDGKLGTPFRRLSGGQKQRLSIALALLGSPRVAVLDELTTGLDPQARRDVWGLVERIRARGVTILLVTHFMEEAERLCDRLAVIDGGRVVAVDSPAGLVARADDRQRIRFRLPGRSGRALAGRTPSGQTDSGRTGFDPSVFERLPEVSSVEQNGGQIVVTGTGNLLLAVAEVLSRHRIPADGLRVEQATLDDAFVALTGRPAEN